MLPKVTEKNLGRTSPKLPWQDWTPFAAAGFSLVYTLVALYWAGGGQGFPWGASANDPLDRSDDAGFFVRLQPFETGMSIAAFCLFGVVCALLIANRSRARPWRYFLATYAWTTTALALLGVLDERLLMAVAYLPIILVNAVFGFMPLTVAEFLEKALTWAMVNQIICLAGGLLWGLTALFYTRLLREACPACGRGEGPLELRTLWFWGRWSVGIAIGLPLFYIGTRVLWLLNIPFGIDPNLLNEFRASGSIWSGAGLAAVAGAGALLTLGLIKPWGEVFPRWLPVIGGKRVPVALAVLPATIIAAMLIAGPTKIMLFHNGATTFSWRWSELVTNPIVWFPLWGVALGIATWTYYLRRRGVCGTCGRGQPIADLPSVP